MHALHTFFAWYGSDFGVVGEGNEYPYRKYFMALSCQLDGEMAIS